MLSQTSRRNKQNQIRTESAKQNHSLVHSTINHLRQQISTLQQQKSMIEKQWIAQVDLLTLEVNQYKKKLASLTDKYLIQTFTKDKHQVKEPHNDHEKLMRQMQVLLEQQQQSKKKIEQQIKKWIDQNSKLKKEITILKYEKEKNMEISLTEKIQIQEKNKLLQQEVKSKKQIIANLKKQIEKAYSDRQNLTKRQRTVEQKSKELDCYSRQVNEYNRLSEVKLNQKVERLTKQNQFLKDYVKKLQKLAKKECECETKDDKVKQNLFEIKRELALAKVRLGQSYLKRKEAPRSKQPKCSSPSGSQSQSIDKKYR